MKSRQPLETSQQGSPPAFQYHIYTSKSINVNNERLQEVLGHHEGPVGHQQTGHHGHAVGEGTLRMQDTRGFEDLTAHPLPSHEVPVRHRPGGQPQGREVDILQTEHDRSAGPEGVPLRPACRCCSPVYSE